MSHAQSEISQAAAVSRPRRFRARRWLMLLFAVTVLVGGASFVVDWIRSAREQEALNFVRLNGFTAEGYRHSWVSSFLTFLPPHPTGRPFAAVPVVTAAFPRDRMTDSMVDELLVIRHLEAIRLYPPDPDGSGVDFTATVLTAAPSLRDLGLPLSERSIGRLEERFPALQIWLVSRPQPAAAAESPVEAEGKPVAP